MNARPWTLLPHLLLLALFLAAWHYGTQWLEVPEYLLPGPIEVARAFWEGYATPRFWPHLAATLQEMALGYLIGCCAALLFGALVAEFPLLERLASPYVVGLQSVPKVAVAPLIIVWFGFGIASKVVLIALICFFPVFVNCVAGLKSANPDLLDLYRAFSASRLAIFRNVKLPSAASSIFSGLQISVVMALIGAVVGEFIAAQKGLGYLIQASTLRFDVATMFAAIISLSIIGILATAALRALQARIVFWEGRRRSTATAAEAS